jgi:hypothetical protein
MSAKVSLITEQPIGASSFSPFPGQMSCLSIYGYIYGLVLEITRPLQGNMTKQIVAKRTAKSLCGALLCTACKLFSTNILTAASSCLHVYE